MCMMCQMETTNTCVVLSQAVVYCKHSSRYKTQQQGVPKGRNVQHNYTQFDLLKIEKSGPIAR